jgi:hypothetical protein
MLDVRRLLQHGSFYCHPLVETFNGPELIGQDKKQYSKKKRRREGPLYHSEVVDTTAYAVIPLPPLSTQVEAWIDQASTWYMPHLRQIRVRLYILIRINVVHLKRTPSILPLHPSWTQDLPSVTEFRRTGTGNSARIEQRSIGVPHYDFVSIGFTPKMLQDDDDDLSMDRALMFCALGSCKQMTAVRSKAAHQYGSLVLASIMLPFNLASLLILLGTCPRLDGYPLPAPQDAELISEELDKVLPLVTVACHHALLLVTTVSVLWDATDESTLASKPWFVSDTIDYEKAMLVWQGVRRCRNLEQLATQKAFVAEDNANIRGYMNEAFEKLSLLHPQDADWKDILREWNEDAMALWEVWWDVFEMDDVL